MQCDKLRKAIKGTLSKRKVVELAKIVGDSDSISLKELIDLTFDENLQVGFRASWILENIFLGNQKDFIPASPYFLEKFVIQGNPSCQRHYTKLLAIMTNKKAPYYFKSVIDDFNTTQIVETVFSWLIEEKVPVAVKSNCLDILANLNTKHKWIKAELLETMHYLMDKESIAFHSKAKMIKKRLAS